MPEQSFFETEALLTLLNAASSRLGISASDLQNITDEISDQDATRLNGELVEILKLLPSTAIEMEEELPPPGIDQSRLSFRIWRQTNSDRQPNKMLFIRVKDAAPTVGIGLVGLVLALATLSPSAITSGMSTVKGVYDNFVKLKSPEDDDAMSIYDALLKCAATITVETEQPSVSGVKAAELADFGGPSGDRAAKALKRLKDLSLAEVAAWGDSGGDLAHPDNLWRLRA
ncbi:hypothetical protein [Bradyrhizobium sp. dw_78]|uniref:hypothetical protein n=1 Tax=Bradyrhizobium sp. dw_78 TaxID=2719793 RepID=UPI001BD6D5E0|nr:hypothetical protein [Bradyrhizobium sp. dw_78]